MVYFASALILSFIANASLSVRHPSYNRLPLDECGVSMGDRIVGGSRAHMGQYPWMARVGYSLTNCPKTQLKPSFLCAGSLITDQHVISAAHCVTHNLTQLCNRTGLIETRVLSQIRLGEYNVDEVMDCDDNICANSMQDFGVSDIVYHGSYDKPFKRNDISLIKLNKKVTFTKWVKPICLPFGEMLTTNYTGRKAVVAGWGYMKPTIKIQSNILLHVDVPIAHISKCIETFRGFANISNSQLCAGGLDGKSSCRGDSGGPLMMNSTILGLPRYFLLGIVSFGTTKCVDENKPAVYTNVPSYMTWILNNIEFD